MPGVHLVGTPRSAARLCHVAGLAIDLAGARWSDAGHDPGVSATARSSC